MKWFRLTERLPQEGEHCLVVIPGHDGKPICLMSWFTYKPFGSERGHFTDGFAFDDSDVHWHHSGVLRWAPIELPADVRISSYGLTPQNAQNAVT